MAHPPVRCCCSPSFVAVRSRHRSECFAHSYQHIRNVYDRPTRMYITHTHTHTAVLIIRQRYVQSVFGACAANARMFDAHPLQTDGACVCVFVWDFYCVEPQKCSTHTLTLVVCCVVVDGEGVAIASWPSRRRRRRRRRHTKRTYRPFVARTLRILPVCASVLHTRAHVRSNWMRACALVCVYRTYTHACTRIALRFSYRFVFFSVGWLVLGENGLEKNTSRRVVCAMTMTTSYRDATYRGGICARRCVFFIVCIIYLFFCWL